MSQGLEWTLHVQRRHARKPFSAFGHWFRHASLSRRASLNRKHRRIGTTGHTVRPAGCRTASGSSGGTVECLSSPRIFESSCSRFGKVPMKLAANAPSLWEAHFSGSPTASKFGGCGLGTIRRISCRPSGPPLCESRHGRTIRRSRSAGSAFWARSQATKSSTRGDGKTASAGTWNWKKGSARLRIKCWRDRLRPPVRL